MLRLHPDHHRTVSKRRIKRKWNVVKNVTAVFMVGENVLSWNDVSTRINLAVLRELVRSPGCSKYQFSSHVWSQADHLYYSRRSLKFFEWNVPGKGQDTKRRVFFRCLLHQQVSLKVHRVSLPLTTFRTVTSSMWHGERAIAPVWSHLPIKLSCEWKNNWRACTMRNERETKRIHQRS